jgi:hypothetical protein
MGIIGDIINIPIRVLKLPLKVVAHPLKIGWHIIFGSKKDQMEQEKQNIRDEFEKKKEALQAPVPFYLSDPGDVKVVCAAVDPETASKEIKGICKMAGGRTRRLRKGQGKGQGNGRRKHKKQTKVRYQ